MAEIPQNRTSTTDPDLKDLFDLFKKDILLSFNCHAIAKIDSFDSVKQTCSAVIQYKKTYFERQSEGVYTPVLVDYPVLLDIPVQIVGGVGANLTFPTDAIEGATALILFNDRDIDNWFKSGQIAGVASPRLHSFSDGIAIVGLRSMAEPVEDYDEDRVVLNNEGTKVALGVKIEISNDAASLYTLLNTLLTDMLAVFTAMSSATPATVVATIATPSATLVTQLTALQTMLGELLE